jgi:hypothetical protein
MCANVVVTYQIPMTFILIFSAITVGAAFFSLLLNLRNAPLGYEDNKGFYFEPVIFDDSNTAKLASRMSTVYAARKTAV